ncbi:MAG: FGGY-family carbohydrate kinase [Eubacteriaceae bacterium]|nr:FGGY-family carbohydrate kinase [Eubacteriaceae bacterium]
MSEYDDGLVLAVDIGTQSLKVMLVDRFGHMPALVRRRYSEAYLSDEEGRAEQKADFYWDEACAAIRELKDRFPSEFSRMCAVTITTIRDTFVCLGRDLSPVRDVILWMDRREAPDPQLSLLQKILFGAVGKTEMIKMQYRKSMCNWIRVNEPEIWEKTYKYATLSGYFNYRMCGKLIDSVSSLIGHVPFDMKKHRWMSPGDIRMCVFPMDTEKYFDYAETGSILGYVDDRASAETGIPAGIALYASGSDKGCETLGMSCTDTDKAAVSLGTAAAVQVTSRKYMEPFPFISAYPAVVPGCCSPEVQLYSGFWLVSWFRDNLAHYEKEAAGREGGSPEQYLDSMLPQIPAGSEGLVFSPYFIAGVEMPKARGAYIGFTDRHTRAHMYRALIEGIALALRTGLEHLEKKGRFSVRDIYICGGGAVSDEVCRIVASVFGLPVHRTEAPEASGVGCAVSVFTAMGVYSSHEQACSSMVRIADTFLPDERDAAVYEKEYREIFSKMYPRLLPFFRKYDSVV